jgi:hypothetical protein
MCRAAAQFAAHPFHLRVQAWAFMATRPRRRRNDKPQRTPNHKAKQSRNDDERT